jgi:hypothetical protein
MIKDRNVDPAANILPTKILGAGGDLAAVAAKTVYVGTSGTNAYNLARARVDNADLVTTLNAAVALCTANRGDRIIVLPGHYEDLADTSSSGAIDLDVAGISVLGVGSGSLMPRIDFNHADSDFIVGANNITIDNIHFEATVTVVKIGIAIEAGVTGTTISNCKFTVETTTTDEFLIGINLLAGCDDTTIKDCFMDMGLGGAATGIKLVGASDTVKVQDSTIMGDYSQACIAGITTLSTNVLIERNLLVNGNANALGTVEVIELLTGTLGIIRDNTWFCDVATHVLMCVGDTCLYSNNKASDDSGSGSTTATTSASVVASADG